MRDSDSWRVDLNKTFRIDKKIVTDYFDKKQHLVFGNESARKEEKVLRPFIDRLESPSILDLGCGNGRWLRILIEKCKRYVGVDISRNFIRKLKRDYKDNPKVQFFNMPVQEYLSNESFDIILMLGLITYMNDDEVMQLVKNCKNMLNRDGKIILRSVELKDDGCSRKVYDYNPNFIDRLLGRQAYQVIRRTKDEEMSFFRDFNLEHMSNIEGTGYIYYILKK